MSLSSRPHILITNDDGIHAPGIKALYEALYPFAKISVVAPAKEQSAVSVCLTIREPIKVERDRWNKDSTIWSVNGTPADCVKLAINALLDERPDIVVSGINRGSNAGKNVLYSGTVGGVIEACMQKIPGVAFSCYDFFDPDYSLAAPHIVKIVEHVLKHPLPQGSLLNVNFPPKKLGEIKGFKLARQGKEYWGEAPERREHPTGDHVYYWLGAKIISEDEHEESDIAWLHKGYCAAVPVHVEEMTDHRYIRDAALAFDTITH